MQHRSWLWISPLFVALLATSGCAGMMAAWRAEHCNYDGAFKAGMNDSRRGGEMNSGAYHCDPAVRAEVERGYRDGYTRGVPGNVVMVAGAVPGPGPAPGPGWKCERAYGKEDCGFKCSVAYGDIACAKQPHHQCVVAYGKVRCGQNCRPQFGDIACDE